MGFVKKRVSNAGIARLLAVALVVCWVLLLAGCLSPAPARLACAQEDDSLTSGATQLWVRLDGDSVGLDAAAADGPAEDAADGPAQEATDDGQIVRSASTGQASSRTALAKTADHPSVGMALALAAAGTLVLVIGVARPRRVLCVCVVCCLLTGLAVGPAHAGVAREPGVPLEAASEENGSDPQTSEKPAQAILVSFDADGGMGSMADVAVESLGNTSLPACSLVRDGFVFAGWDVRSDNWRKHMARLWPQARDGDTLRIEDRAHVSDGALTCFVMRDGARVGEVRVRLAELAQNGRVGLVAAWAPKAPDSAESSTGGEGSRATGDQHADKVVDKTDPEPSEAGGRSTAEAPTDEVAHVQGVSESVAEDIGVAASDLAPAALGAHDGWRTMRTVTLLSAVEGQDDVAVEVAEGEGRVPQCPFAWARHAFVDWVVVGLDSAHVVPGEQLPAGDVTLRAHWEKRAPESVADGLDFSSCRLIVASQERPSFGTVVSEHEGVWLVQFGDAVDAAWAYADHVSEVDFMAPDIEIAVASNGGEEPETLASATVEGTDAALIPNEAPPLQAAIEAAIVPSAPMLPDAGPLGTEDAIDTGPVADLACSDVRAGAYEGTVGLIDTGVNGYSDNVVARLSAIDSFAYDDNGHGTSMVGTILAMEPQTHVVSIRALDAMGKGSAASVYAAIQTAIRAGCKVVNLSICAPAVEGNAAVEQAIRDAHAAGVMVVGAAGNDGKDAKWYVPGKMGDQAVIVGSCDADGNRNANSNFGDTVDLYVPSASTSYASAKVAAWLAAHATFGHELEALLLPEAKEALGYVTEVEQGNADQSSVPSDTPEFRTAWTHPTIHFEHHWGNIGWATNSNNGKTYNGHVYKTYGSSANDSTLDKWAGGNSAYWENSLQAIKISIKSGSSTSGSISYMGSVQNKGYTSWVSNGALLGTTGQGLRLEAWKVKLTGDIAKQYYLEYKGWTHVPSNTSLDGIKSSNTDSQQWCGIVGKSAIQTSASVRIRARSFAQTVQVRYQNANGTWGAYGNVINTNYATGSAVSWSRAQDATYNAASISYTVTSANTKQISVSRRSATNTIQVRYQNADGSWGAYATVSSGNDLVGASRSWSRAQDATYKAASATITGTATAQTKKVDVARRTYTIKFDGNGATGGSAAERTLYVGQQTVLPGSTFTYGGHTCVGWNTASNGTGTAYGASASAKDLAGADQAVTLYAQWRTHAYRVAFDANAPDASGSMEEVSTTYDVLFSLPQNGFVRSLYNFNAWNTRPDGSGTWMRDAQEVKNLTDQDGACVTLYAQWNPKQMRVSVPAAIHFVAQDDGVMVGPDDDVARIVNQGEVTMRLGEARTELDDSAGFQVGFEVPDRAIAPGESMGMRDVRGFASVPVMQDRQIGCIHWNFVAVG